MSDASTLANTESAPKRIFLVSYPKIVFLYPTFLLAIASGIYLMVTGAGTEVVDEGNHRAGELVALLFLCVGTLNLAVLAFDFPRTTSLTLFFFIAAVAMGIVLLFHFQVVSVAGLENIFAKLRPYANAQFYFLSAGLLFLMYIGVLVSVQFDYWEVRPNELLHHHGMLSDLKRFSAPNLRIDKEINDVFEYMLLRSGRLILHPSNERRAIILENVFFINRKEQQITQMLGALQVQVRTDDE